MKQFIHKNIFSEIGTLYNRLHRRYLWPAPEGFYRTEISVLNRNIRADSSSVLQAETQTLVAGIERDCTRMEHYFSLADRIISAANPSNQQYFRTDTVDALDMMFRYVDVGIIKTTKESMRRQTKEFKKAIRRVDTDERPLLTLELQVFTLQNKTLLEDMHQVELKRTELLYSNT